MGCSPRLSESSHLFDDVLTQWGRTYIIQQRTIERWRVKRE